jgi:CheY-like chemotaxis protein
MEKPMILIAEDEPPLRTLLCTILEDQYRLQLAYNGLEAVRFLCKYSVDLFLLDLVMPVMNGIEVLNWIEKKGIDVPVILLSSFDIENQPHLFGAFRINRFISKPFEIAELCDSIPDTIQSHKHMTEAPFLNNLRHERRLDKERRKGERRSEDHVDCILIFKGVAMRRQGIERRKGERRRDIDRWVSL